MVDHNVCLLKEVHLNVPLQFNIFKFVLNAVIQMSFSPQILWLDQYQKSARVVSIVMFKYDFPRIICSTVIGGSRIIFISLQIQSISAFGVAWKRTTDKNHL
jgi:hypothetical protein